MSEEVKTQATIDSEDFMAGTPTREEVNKYMNNLFMMINNNFGIFQGYTIAAISATMVDYLSALGSSVTLEEFTKTFSEHNTRIIKEAEEKMKAMQAEADSVAKGTAAKSTVPVPDKEVDISML
ncbi:MAG: hypothetical protein EB127_05110 [Alphaproteobacteria bacterium]|nr:hypothetical protein [Alphaproteobacteria bacterium]